MSILQDISGQDQLVAMNAMVASISSLTDEELFERIPKAESAGMAILIYSGCMYIELRKRHQGHFTDILEKRGRDLGEVEELMFIAREFDDPSQWRYLPGHKRTLRILARIPREIRDQWIEKEKINVNTTKAVAIELVRAARRLHNKPAQAIGSAVEGIDVGEDGERDDNPGGATLSERRDSDGDRDDGDHGKDHEEDRGNGQTININNDRNDIGADSKAESARKDARIEELLRQVKQRDDKIAVYEPRIAELEATIGFDVGWNQRCALKNAIETVEGALKHKVDSGERYQAVKRAGDYIVDLVLTARHRGLSTERFDLVYRPKVEEKHTIDEETSFAASAAEPQPEQVGI